MHVNKTMVDFEKLYDMQKNVKDNYDGMQLFGKGHKILICNKDEEQTGDYYILREQLKLRTHDFLDENYMREKTLYLLGGADYYKESHTEKGIPIFLKMVSIEKRLGVAKFEKESRFEADFPYIERVYRMDLARFEEDTERKCLFLVLAVEFIDGLNYYKFFSQDKLRRSDGLFDSRNDELLMYKIWYQMLCAVRFYYEDRRNVHRDLHPENIMIRDSADGGKRSVIIDFDSAHIENLRSITLPPEVRQYEVAGDIALKLPRDDIRRDCFSLGWLFMYAVLGEDYYNYYCVKFKCEPQMYDLNNEILKNYSPGYLDDKYNNLFELIREMVSAPKKQIKNFNSIAYITDLIKKYERLVLVELADSQERKMIRHPDSYLEPRVVQDSEKTRFFILQCAGKFTEDLLNYESRELSFTKEPREAFEDPHLCVQNINGELFYVPYDKSIRTNVQNYRLSDSEENWFEMNGMRISLKFINR